MFVAAPGDVSTHCTRRYGIRIGFVLAVRIACASVTSIMHAYKREV